MTLRAGARLGPYEITALIGEGGMGKVWRAHHSGLKRDDALKVLPDAFASDPDRLARFRREAHVLASLNHPNIAHVYGLEQTDGVQALVMELVEGPTLADRIAHGPIPVDEVLPIAKQIAEALEAAHEQGIVHRDLKPANIKVRPDGTVKVLDFGLAKALEPVSGSSVDATASPTITSPAMMTGVGVLLGTAAYMSPEQARGKPADRRSDIWAFGCVLYEMLSGRRAFEGDIAETLGAVIHKEPQWDALPPRTPTTLRTLVNRCLQKDLKRRLPHVGMARFEIDDALSAPASSVREVRQRTRTAAQRLGWVAAGLLTIVTLMLAWVHFSEEPLEAPSSIRFSVVPPSGMRFPGNEGDEGQWLSPDGRHIAFRVTPTGNIGMAKLAVRTFNESDARLLAGSDGAANAFWSPDSRFLGFFAGGKLQKVDITGGPPQVICDAPFVGGGLGAGGTWNMDGTIVFGTGTADAGLFRVSSSGGTPIQVTKPDEAKNEAQHRHPWFLPDGRHFLYIVRSARGSFSTNSVHIGSLDGAPPAPLMQADARAIYVDGFMLFVRNGALLAQRFDVDRLEAAGDPIVVVQNIAASTAAATASFSASETGMLSYRTTSPAGVVSQLTWFDRSGEMLSTVGDRIDQADVQLSPDGNRVAVSVLDPARRTRDLWIYELAREGLRTRLTFDAGEDWASAWSPDSRSLIFSGGRPEPLDLYRKNADGSGSEERLLERTDGPNKYARSWSPDGRFLLYNSGSARSETGSNDLWVLSISSADKPRPFLQTPFEERHGRLSADGKWVAYASNESGRDEIYVLPFASRGGKWQISTAGGDDPRWRRDGRELFYVQGDTIMAAEVQTAGPVFQVAAVRPLFNVRRRTSSYLGFGPGSVFDVTADGQRFLVNVADDEEVAPPPITIITSWAMLR